VAVVLLCVCASVSQARDRRPAVGARKTHKSLLASLEPAPPAGEQPPSSVAAAVVGRTGAESVASLAFITAVAAAAQRAFSMGLVDETSRDAFNAISWVCIVFRRSEVIGGPPDANSPEWFKSVTENVWIPPTFAFPLVWVPLKLLQCFAAAALWRSVGYRASHPAVLALALHLALGMQWNRQFFVNRRIATGLYVIVAYWGALLAAVLLAWRTHPPAAAMLLPSLLWVALAASLNANIWLANRSV